MSRAEIIAAEKELNRKLAAYLKRHKKNECCDEKEFDDIVKERCFEEQLS